MLKHRLLALSLALVATLGLSLALASDFILNRLFALGLTFMVIIGISLPLSPDLILINLADTHSAYDNYPRLLSIVENIVQEHEGTPTYILFNGDLFDRRNNVVALRSKGEIDWVFLEALQAQAPVIFNVGDHEFDFMNPAEFVSEAQARGVRVISNIFDKTTGKLIAPAATALEVAGKRVDVLGLATPELATYHQEAQPNLQLTDPVHWIRDNYTHFTTAGDWSVLLSHAGLGTDRRMLPNLPNNTLVVGAHHHLVFRETLGRSRTVYMHNGFRAERVNVTKVSFVGDITSMEFEDFFIGAATPSHSELQARIEQVRGARLTSEDLTVMGALDRTYSVVEAAYWAVETLREASGADVAVINNNFFYAGLPGGALPLYRFNEFAPFDSDLVTTEIDGRTLAGILAIANLSTTTPLEKQRPYFVYASHITPQEDERYTIVTSASVARFAEGLLGTAELEFETIPETTVKALLKVALERQAR